MCKCSWAKNKYLTDSSKEIEKKYASQCRLISVRRKTIEEATLEISQLKEEEVKHIGLAEQFEKDSERSLVLLPVAMEKLFGVETQEKVQNVMTFVSSLANELLVNRTSKTIHRNSIFPSLSDEKEMKSKYRLLLQEIDRIDRLKDDRAASAMLHATPQLFPKEVLQQNLEIELNKMICQEISDNETNHPLLKLDQNDINAMDNLSVDTFDSQEYDEIPNKGDFEFNPIDSHSDTNAMVVYQWKDPRELDTLVSQRDDLGSRILRLKKERRNSMKLSGKATNALTELEEKMRCATVEKTRIEDTIKLAAIDADLHAVTKRVSKYFVVRSLHGYDTLMHRSEAVDALSAEHDHLVATLVSREIIDDALDR